MSILGSPLGVSTVVQAALAYPKSAITIAACCAALAGFTSGGPHDVILDDPVCIEASCPLDEPLPQIREVTLLPPVKNSCPVKPETTAPVIKTAKKNTSRRQQIRKPGEQTRPVVHRPRKPKQPVVLDDCGNPVLQ